MAVSYHLVSDEAPGSGEDADEQEENPGLSRYGPLCVVGIVVAATIAGVSLVLGNLQPTSSRASKANLEYVTEFIESDGGQIDWKELRLQLPFGKEDPHAEEKWIVLFEAWDHDNSDGFSWAELESAVMTRIKGAPGVDMRPALKRAFETAKTLNRGENDEYVRWKDFRFCLEKFYENLKYWVDFQTIDANGDKLVDLTEFEKGQAYIENLIGKEIAPASEFVIVDRHGSGHVRFDDFAEWAAENVEPQQEKHLR